MGKKKEITFQEYILNQVCGSNCPKDCKHKKMLQKIEEAMRTGVVIIG